MDSGIESDSADIEKLKKEIRMIAHDISNPLGILRMAIYYLETAKPLEEKRMQYFSMMGQNIDKMEGLIKRLRVVGGSPSIKDLPRDEKQ